MTAIIALLHRHGNATVRTCCILSYWNRER